MSTIPADPSTPTGTRAGFWSQTTVQSRLAQIVTTKIAPQVKQGAIELRMGQEAFVTGGSGRIALAEQSGEVVIPPGQFALLLTEEKVTIPPEAIGFISIKFGLKARGLVNVSGFHVDPGFSGWLTFGVYNAGPGHVTISRGKEAFLLWLASLDQPLAEAEKYSPTNNTGRGQTPKLDDDLIMNLQGDIASPGALSAKLEELRKQFTTVVSYQRIIITICGALLIAMFTWTVNRGNQTVPASGGAVAPSTAPVPNTAPQPTDRTIIKARVHVVK